MHSIYKQQFPTSSKTIEINILSADVDTKLIDIWHQTRINEKRREKTSIIILWTIQRRSNTTDDREKGIAGVYSMITVSYAVISKIRIQVTLLIDKAIFYMQLTGNSSRPQMHCITAAWRPWFGFRAAAKILFEF